MGRRTAKINLSSKRIKRFLWDGNVPLHEWEYDLSERPNLSRDKDNLLVYGKEEPVTDNLITWVFDEGSFVPCAKLVNGESFSIITDHLGTPYEAYDEEGQKVWARELDLYGNAIAGDSSFIPFLYQGQYYDEEIGLAYNRFRYYSPESGTYISQDPIGLAGNNPNFYGYVKDSNWWVDVFGLDCSGEKESKLLKIIAKIKAKLNLYPNVIDPRTGRRIPLPFVSNKVPKEDRVDWNKEERRKYIAEWYDRGYETPQGGWDKYDIHHIKPREFGGDNTFENLVPVERNTHQKEFNTFWREFGEL